MTTHKIIAIINLKMIILWQNRLAKNKIGMKIGMIGNEIQCIMQDNMLYCLSFIMPFISKSSSTQNIIYSLQREI